MDKTLPSLFNYTTLSDLAIFLFALYLFHFARSDQHLSQQGFLRVACLQGFMTIRYKIHHARRDGRCHIVSCRKQNILLWRHPSPIA